MQATAFSLYLDIEEGQVADLEVVARASLAFADAVRDTVTTDEGVGVSESGRREDSQPQPSSAASASNPSERDKPPAPTFQPMPDEWNAEEKRHRRWEKGYWVTILVFTFLGGAGAIASGFYTYSAAYQARRQADATDETLQQSKAGARPYLIPEFMGDEGLSPQPWKYFTPGHGGTAPLWQTYDLHFRLTNYGSPPAILRSIQVAIIANEQTDRGYVLDASYETGLPIAAGGKTDILTASYQFSPASFGAMQRERYPLHIAGLARFTSVAGEAQSFKFCYLGKFDVVSQKFHLVADDKDWLCATAFR